jgi:N-acetylglucosaminyl-diphospho-decaprenol L-rhamnosyltransferase
VTVAGEPRLACVVVAYRSERPLQTLLRTIRLHEPRAAVLVVDNASPEGSPSLAKPVEVHTLAENRGYGAACNVGAARVSTSTEYLAFLNPDLALQGPTLSLLLDEFERRPQLGIATGPIVDENNQRVASAWGAPSITRAFWAATGWQLPRLRAVVGRLLRSGASQSGASMRNRPLEVDGHVLGGAMMVRRDCFAQLGGFDERFFLYWEDADLCTRARAAGWAVMMLPAIPMLHVEGTSSAGVSDEQRWTWYREGAERYAKLHLRPWRARALLIAMDLGGLIGRSWR